MLPYIRFKQWVRLSRTKPEAAESIFNSLYDLRISGAPLWCNSQYIFTLFSTPFWALKYSFSRLNINAVSVAAPQYGWIEGARFFFSFFWTMGWKWVGWTLLLIGFPWHGEGPGVWVHAGEGGGEVRLQKVKFCKCLLSTSVRTLQLRSSQREVTHGGPWSVLTISAQTGFFSSFFTA